jgi:uncharacterized delta-60 repeat protein
MHGTAIAHGSFTEYRSWRAATSIASCIALFLAVGLSQPALAVPGDLDNSFSNDGKVTTLMGTGSTQSAVAQSVAIQPDGKIVVAGQVGGSNTERFALARYKTNGNLDNTFSGDGKVTTSFGSLAGAHSVALQADGKIVAVGWKLSGNNTRFALARYKTNGNLDNTFGTLGKVTTPIGSNSDASSVAIQADGMIVVAGDALVNNNTRFALARYQTNGTLDTAFGVNSTGKVHTPIGLAAEAGSVAIQPSDGKIVAAGYSTNVSNSRFALARYQTNGTLDTTFGVAANGTVITPFGSSSIAGATSVAIQTGGEIVAAGYSGSGSNSRFALARYLTNGTLDTTFGVNANGKVTTTMGPFSDATSVAIQPSDGKLVVAGHALQGNNGVMAVARYDSIGGLDTTFGNAGKVKTLIGSSAYASAVAIQPSDGKLVVAGQGSTGPNFRFAIVRYDG